MLPLFSPVSAGDLPICTKMSVRGLFYMARIYQNYINKRGLNLYSTRRISLPVPVYVIFYNGQKRSANFYYKRTTRKTRIVDYDVDKRI